MSLRKKTIKDLRTMPGKIESIVSSNDILSLLDCSKDSKVNLNN